MSNLVRPYIGYKFSYEGRELEVTSIDSMFVMIRDHTNQKNLKLAFDSEKYPKIFLPMDESVTHDLPDMSEFLETHSGKNSLEKDPSKSSKKEKSAVELKCREMWDRILQDGCSAVAIVNNIIAQNKYERVIDLSIYSEKQNYRGLASTLLVWAELNREKICANPEMLMSCLIDEDEAITGMVSGMKITTNMLFKNLTDTLLKIFESPSDESNYSELKRFVNEYELSIDLRLLMVVLFADGLMPNFKLELRGIKSETLGFLVDRFDITLSCISN